jgi:hypothetical protein
VKWKRTRRILFQKLVPPAAVLCAERLSRMMWICCRAGHRAATSFEEGDEVLAGVAGGGFAVHPAGGRFQGGIERQRSVPVVFETVPLERGRARAAGRDRAGRAPEWRSFRRRRRRPHARAGSEYRPMMSAALLSKSGSSLAM